MTTVYIVFQNVNHPEGLFKRIACICSTLNRAKEEIKAYQDVDFKVTGITYTYEVWQVRE